MQKDIDKNIIIAEIIDKINIKRNQTNNKNLLEILKILRDNANNISSSPKEDNNTKTNRGFISLLLLAFTVGIVFGFGLTIIYILMIN